MDTLQVTPKPTAKDDEVAQQAQLDAVGRYELEKAERSGGRTFEEIAQELGISVSRLYHLKTDASWSTRTLCKMALVTDQGVVAMIAQAFMRHSGFEERPDA